MIFRKKNVIRIVLTVLLLLSVPTAFATERLVPSQYATIQAAVDDCNDGDVVVISPGTYRGPGNREIDLAGRAITVCSIEPDNFRIADSTIIDCEIAGRGFIFRTGEDANSVVSGLTIINGHSLLGGAIYCRNKSSPTISNCAIIGNSATLGGGVACSGGSQPTINNCTINSNSGSMGGGAIYCNTGGPTISNSLISNNVAPAGGGISCALSNLVVRNCTFSSNDASRGGGIYCYNSSNVTIENSILWGNTSKNRPQILVSKSGNVSSLTVSHCNMQGGEPAAIVEEGCTLNWDDGNLDAEPMFVTGPLGDYYLDPNSSCVNAGNVLAANLDLDEFSTRADGLDESGIVDMGYHYPSERTIQRWMLVEEETELEESRFETQE
jgi:hypothetical protein